MNWKTPNAYTRGFNDDEAALRKRIIEGRKCAQYDLNHNASLPGKPFQQNYAWCSKAFRSKNPCKISIAGNEGSILLRRNTKHVCIPSRLHLKITKVKRVPAVGAQLVSDPGRQIVVNEESQDLRTSGISRS